MGYPSDLDMRIASCFNLEQFHSALSLFFFSNFYSRDLQGVPDKVTEFQTKITLEILSLEKQYRYFWKAETCSCLAG